ncbi:MAG: hypothetical protein K2X47_15355 [Bdellovibrionales bacterium]|nr:hypothetical protein [Bdellovibrionales bacterium]
MKALFMCILTFVIAGCGSMTLPKYSQLTTLRILSLKASTPDVGDTNATVTFSPIISDENGGSRAITQSVTHCPASDLVTGATPTCDGVVGAQTQTLGAVNFTSSFRTSAPSQNQFTVQIPANYLQSCATTTGTGACPLVTRTNGRPYLIVYQLTTGAETLTAIRRVFVKDTSLPGLVLNSNPDLTSISNGSASLNEGTASTKPNGTVSLSASIPSAGSPGGPETYSYLNSSGVASRSEDFLVSWFTNRGSYKYTRTDLGVANELVADTTGGTLSLVVVLRDGRGGEDAKVFNYAP